MTHIERLDYTIGSGVLLKQYADNTVEAWRIHGHATIAATSANGTVVVDDTILVETEPGHTTPVPTSTLHRDWDTDGERHHLIDFTPDCLTITDELRDRMAATYAADWDGLIPPAPTAAAVAASKAAHPSNKEGTKPVNAPDPTDPEVLEADGGNGVLVWRALNGTVYAQRHQGRTVTARTSPDGDLVLDTCLVREAAPGIVSDTPLDDLDDEMHIIDHPDGTPPASEEALQFYRVVFALSWAAACDRYPTNPARP